MNNAAPKIDFAAAAWRLGRTRINPRERRRFRRLPLVVGGRMLDTLGREHDCRTADISPGDARIAAPVLPNVGERVVIYLDGLGRVCGHVARRGEHDVAVIFDFGAHKREKLTDQLTLAINQDLGIEADEKIPAGSRGSDFACIELETGESYPGQILDFSLTGITIASAKPPPVIGDWVRIGGTYGRVARLIEGGFAVDFAPRAPQQA